MLLRILIFLAGLFVFLGCWEKKMKNHLEFEKSPYLRQHAKNPIWWHAWNEEAFKRAKKEDKPIFLSVGYSTCHWCHVMEKESFEHEDVGRKLNDHYVSIKVDREERPDVDSIYMDAVHAMNGQGGWPMTVIMTPDREPFFGATYIPKQRLLELLGKVDEVWKKDRDKINESGRKMAAWIAEDKSGLGVGSFDDSALGKFHEAFMNNFDEVYGGKLGAPKFPPAYGLRMLLHIYRRSGSKESLMIVKKTLTEMSRGGIYDHLVGGFHRYSTDEKWLVPHFEKMLYDQSSLTQAYTEAFQVTGEKEYALVVGEILDYVLREMTSPKGGFYTAEDADSEGEEGKFCVWSHEELEKALSKEEFAEVIKVFGITESGNFEHDTNILNLQKDQWRNNRTDRLREAIKKMQAIRKNRVPPLRDEKVITSWNGLMISAMAKAGRVLREEKYITAAAKAADFILNELWDSGELKRRWIEDEAKLEANLNDYAFMVNGFIELYLSTQESQWLDKAKSFQSKLDELFWDSEKGGYFFTSGRDKTLIRRGKEYFDNVVPAGNSVSALNLLQLSDLLLEKTYRQRFEKLLASLPQPVFENPIYVPQLMLAVDYYLDRSKEIAVVGPKNSEMLSALQSEYNPNMVIAAGLGSVPLLKGKTQIQAKATAYVCEQGICKLPTNDVLEAKKMSLEFKPVKLQRGL